jgi:hypothetical protein
MPAGTDRNSWIDKKEVRMPRNLVSISFSPERLTSLHNALAMVEAECVDLISLPRDQRRGAAMGEKSEMFCRETLGVLEANPKLVSEGLGLTEAKADLAALDALRPILRRLQQLVERAESTEIALGIDIFSAALEGYGVLKISGKHHGLEGKRRELSGRFVRAAGSAGDPPAAP